MNYSLLAWGANCHSIELLQKKAVRVINFQSPLAHTEPILKGMDQLKFPDMYTCHLIKLYYKLYRNMLPTYFENFIPKYGEFQHDLRHNNIRLPAIRCDSFHRNITVCYACQFSLIGKSNLVCHILECLLACLSISISILHIMQFMIHCVT